MITQLLEIFLIISIFLYKIRFLKDFRETYHRQSSIVVADAGYGSE